MDNELFKINTVIVKLLEKKTLKKYQRIHTVENSCQRIYHGTFYPNRYFDNSPGNIHWRKKILMQLL